MDRLLARRAWALVLRMGLGLLIVACCAACGQRSSPVTSATATATGPAPAVPTAPPAGPLTWTPRTPPVKAPPGRSGWPSLAVSSASQIAYLCAPTGTSAPQNLSIWLTRDGGVTWQPTAPVVVNAPGPFSPAIGSVLGCDLLADADQPGILVARALLPADGCMGCYNTVAYMTSDYGAHWSLLRFPSQPHSFLLALATRGAVSYAIFSNPPESATSADNVFVKSVDGMRTWTTVSVPTVGAAQASPQTEQVMGLWLNPYTGALLVETSNSFFNDHHFWSSSAGAQWTALPPPPFPFATDSFVVQQPFTVAPWRICGGDPAFYGSAGHNDNTHIDDLACTADSGAHWVTRHINFAIHPGTPNLPDYRLVAIADDGGLVFSNGSTLERFAIGSGGVASLGPIPAAGIILYASGAGAGALWAGPGGYYPNAGPQGRIFTVSYA